jgi:sialic acid synthase
MHSAAKVVAEIGTIHLGDIGRAFELVRLAKLCGADFAKFQKRDPITCTPSDLHNRPHPNPVFSYGETYLAHRQKLEFSIDQHRELQQYCETIGIGYATSVWDTISAREVIRLNPTYIKVPSACNLDHSLLSLLYNNYAGEIHISTGMLTPPEVDSLVDFLDSLGVLLRTVIYHCTAEYPCSFDHLYLQEIGRLKEIGYQKGFRVGFSNHGYGIAMDVAASVLGATWIERHFTDDRAMRHSDAAASLEPDGLRRVCRDLHALNKAMLGKTELTDGERAQITKLRNL